MGGESKLITNSESKIIYQGNGVAKEFVIGFPFTDKKDLKISIYNETTDKTKDLTYDYFVDIEKKVVIYPGYQVGQEPPENQQPQILQENEKLIIRREIPLTQEVDFGDKHPLEIIEKGFDKLTMIIQSLQEELSRAVKVEISSSTSPEELLDIIKQSRDMAMQAAKDAKMAAEETVEKVSKLLDEKVIAAQTAQEQAQTAQEQAQEAQKITTTIKDETSDIFEKTKDSVVRFEKLPHVWYGKEPPPNDGICYEVWVSPDGNVDGRGATFTPSISANGVISWTNDHDLPNPPAVSIRGPQGITGLQGPQGARGIQGEIGPVGPQGPKGDQGIQGIQGPKGDTGATGPQGPIGLTGPQGPQGAKGEQGEVGPIGPQGKQGLQGPKGDTGARGPKGDKGDSGSVGYMFTPSYNATTGDLSWSNNGGLPNPPTVNIRGLQGPKGDTGAQGPQGIQGPTGATGQNPCYVGSTAPANPTLTPIWLAI